MGGISTTPIDMVSYECDQGGVFRRIHGPRHGLLLEVIGKSDLLAFGGRHNYDLDRRLTRETAFAATIGALDAFIKFGSYYLHERVWDRINYSRAQSLHFALRLSERSENDVATNVGPGGCS